LKIRRLLTAAMAAALVMSLAGTAAAAKPRGSTTTPTSATGQKAAKADALTFPLGEKQADLRAEGVQKVMKGEATPTGNNKVVKVAKGQYVELAREGEDRIWTLLADFGDEIHPSYLGDPGPVHNQIPEPDRSVDNTSIWEPDFSQAYFDDLLFSEAPGAVSMRNFYIEQSSNRYTVNGVVEDWVTVPYNETRYGANVCGDIVCTNVWRFVNDEVDSFASASGMSTADLNAYLAQFDVWDRYDADGDGNFNEPDGYIDHFQAVHAGSGEETGGGAQGTDAIWSHRWYVNFPGSFLGPDGDGPNGYGGVRIGDSDYWIGDYTVEPEDGGIGVFSHEFGHDLGLPDLYDTSGNTGGAENSTAFWTLYSSGSYGSTGQPADGIGSKPISMSAYEKIFLGWSDYTVVGYGQKKSIKLGPATATTKQAQQLVVLLPDKQVDFDLGSPASGSWFWYSGAGNNVDSTMTRSFDLPAGANAFSAKVRYDTEADYDYFYVRVSDDNGASWTTLPTNLSDLGLLGVSGDSGGAWVDWTADIPAGFGGKTVLVRIEYVTDGGVSDPGVNVDDVDVAGVTDDAETDGTWTLAGGFVRTMSEVTRSFFNAYFAENRQYTGYDDGLRTGPYNFGFLDDASLQNWVEHFSYQDGLLVWYYDTSFADNNVGDNCAPPNGRCGGLVLPVDAHPQLSHWADGTLMRPRLQSFDSTFGVDKVPALTVHNGSVATTIPAKPAAKVFNDSTDGWSNCDAHGCTGSHPGRYQPGWVGVDTPNTGTTIRVKSVSRTGFMQVDVNK
jgi:immune inhibitor A